MKRRTGLSCSAAIRNDATRRAGVGGAEAASEDFFIFIHAAGGWDVTLWADPAQRAQGARRAGIDGQHGDARLTHWKGASSTPIPTRSRSRADQGRMRLGPGIGELYDLRDRLTIINGLAMNTVSHPDGTAFSATGRHLAGGRAASSERRLAVANELGVAARCPTSRPVSVVFVWRRLDRRGDPAAVVNAATIASRSRAARRTSPRTIAPRSPRCSPRRRTISRRDSTFPRRTSGIARRRARSRAAGQRAQGGVHAEGADGRVSAVRLQGAIHRRRRARAAFAVEAMKRNLVRCVGFALGGLDTHNQNYKQHAHTQQELFGTIATLVRQLDASRIRRSAAKLSEHTHILVVQRLLSHAADQPRGGRDHYPNNSALVISPRSSGPHVRQDRSRAAAPRERRRRAADRAARPARDVPPRIRDRSASLSARRRRVLRRCSRDASFRTIARHRDHELCGESSGSAQSQEDHHAGTIAAGHQPSRGIRQHVRRDERPHQYLSKRHHGRDVDRTEAVEVDVARGHCRTRRRWPLGHRDRLHQQRCAHRRGWIAFSHRRSPRCRRCAVSERRRQHVCRRPRRRYGGYQRYAYHPLPRDRTDRGRCESSRSLRSKPNRALGSCARHTRKLQHRESNTQFAFVQGKLVVTTKDAVLVETSRGLRRISVPGLRGVAVGNRVWVLSKTALFLVEGTSLIPASVDLADVRSLYSAGDSVWLSRGARLERLDVRPSGSTSDWDAEVAPSFDERARIATCQAEVLVSTSPRQPPGQRTRQLFASVSRSIGRCLLQGTRCRRPIERRSETGSRRTLVDCRAYQRATAR